MMTNEDEEQRGDAFEGCPECQAEGKVNALYYDGVVVACPVHGEVTDPLRMAAYRQHASLFLLGKVPTRTQPALNNEDIA